ncbi:hypothetical protein L9F63_011580, partial [Diploptera punctata]
MMKVQSKDTYPKHPPHGPDISDMDLKSKPSETDQEYSDSDEGSESIYDTSNNKYVKALDLEEDNIQSTQDTDFILPKKTSKQTNLKEKTSDINTENRFNPLNDTNTDTVEKEQTKPKISLLREDIHTCHLQLERENRPLNVLSLTSRTQQLRQFPSCHHL